MYKKWRKCKTGGLQGDPRNSWCNSSSPFTFGNVFKKFHDLRGLAFADDGNVIGRLSQALRLISELKPGFKLDGNLDFNLGKTMFLTKGTTVRHVYDRAQFFLQNDPSLQDIAHDLTSNMFSVEGIEVMGTPIGADTYIISARPILYEHLHSIRECKFYITSPRAFLIGAAHPRRYSHRECNP